MNYFVRSIFSSLSISLLSLPTMSAEKTDRVRFFCDLQNLEMPTTAVSILGSAPWALIRWKYPVPENMTKEQRCQIVSNRFQKTWDRGGGFVLFRKTKSNGLGVICARKDDAPENCEKSDRLFTLRNNNEAREVIEQLKETLCLKDAQCRTNSSPILQSEESQFFNLGKWIDLQSQSQKSEPTK